MDSIIKMDETIITKYTYVDENFENIDYFIGSQIAILLGYKNTTQVIQKTVSIENKVSFKNYIGIKEPKINPRQILINKQGVNELLKTNRKNLTDEIINILINLGINILNDDDDNDDDDDDDKDDKDDDDDKDDKDDEDDKDDKDDEDDKEDEVKNEITMYSYISNHFCFEYFVGYEIASRLGYKNTYSTIAKIVSKCNQIEFRDYPGIKKPKLDPRTILITRDGAIEILLKTRKRITPDVLHMLKEFGITTTNRKCLTKEQQTLSMITDVFKTEKFEDQYKVGNYYIDLYFTEHKIAVECDELGHSDRKPHKERERMDYINEKLDINDCHWIRFNPDEYKFDISKVIGQIYRKIDQIKEIKLQLKKKSTSKEQTISEILNIFNEEEAIEHFDIENLHEVDLYFPKYKIILQSENENMNPEIEISRVNYINKFLNIDYSNWIKYNPDEEGFDTSKVIGQILKLMKQKEIHAKRCCTCRKEKLTSDFYRNKNSSDGFERRCIECKRNFYFTQVKTEKEVPDSKICPQCNENKECSEYWKKSSRKDGLYNICKSCCKEMDQEIIDSEKIVKEFKTCSTCKVVKTTETCFHKRKKSTDGYTGVCKICTNERSKINSKKVINEFI